MGPVTLKEIAAILAVAQDYALGQAPGTQLRATVLGHQLAAAAGLDGTERATLWWTSTLRFLGCTAHAFEMSVVFGDEIEVRAEAARADFSNPIDVLRIMVRHAGSHQAGLARARSVASTLAGGRRSAELSFRTACEVADVFARRLGMEEPVQSALRSSFERWNGRGLPAGLKGTAIPRTTRIAQLAYDLEVLDRIQGTELALATIARRRAKAYDPELADLAVVGGAAWLAELEPADPWDAAVAMAPPGPPLDEAARHRALLVLADFADLKSPWLAGHSRAVAELARQACGVEAGEAALVHDLGRVAVANVVWDKPGPLTRDERDRVHTHSVVTDQLLRRVPALVPMAEIACADHERIDGSGYHRRVGSAHLNPAQRTVAAADCYQAMISDRPYRAALTPDAAATELRALAASGRLDGECVERVLEAAGHRRVARPPLPAGLTAREVDVLRLLALGLTTAQIAQDLVISGKTADHHIQHIYTKIGASTRGAAALFAIEQGILPIDASSGG